MEQDNADMMIDSFVESRRAIEPNPFLSTRVMAKISEPVAEKDYVHPALKFAMVTAGIIGAVAGGIVLGSSYTLPAKEQQAIVINDNQIENFSFYYTLDNE